MDSQNGPPRSKNDTQFRQRIPGRRCRRNATALDIEASPVIRWQTITFSTPQDHHKVATMLRFILCCSFAAVPKPVAHGVGRNKAAFQSNIVLASASMRRTFHISSSTAAGWYPENKQPERDCYGKRIHFGSVVTRITGRATARTARHAGGVCGKFRRRYSLCRSWLSRHASPLREGAGPIWHPQAFI